MTIYSLKSNLAPNFGKPEQAHWLRGSYTSKKKGRRYLILRWLASNASLQNCVMLCTLLNLIRLIVALGGWGVFKQSIFISRSFFLTAMAMHFILPLISTHLQYGQQDR